MSEHVHIAIVGAGFSGIGAAIRLLRAGIDDFVIFEAAARVGGVWRDNRYPGCGCDVESPLYSFSFAPNPDWSRMYSPQPEILAYLERCVDDFGLAPYLRLDHAIEEASWDPDSRCWQIETARGRVSADFVIAGMGALHEPKFPPLRGIDRFEGQAFHSARWPKDAQLAGRRVGVVGTGASAIQIVPNIQAEVGHLSLFQRTAPWIIPRHDRSFSARERQLYAAWPLTQKLLRAAIYLRHEAFIVGFRNPWLMQRLQRAVLLYLAKQVRDPQLRERLTPSFTFGCKRILLSDDYYPALTQANVELIDAGAREVVPEGIIDNEGRLHELDTIVWATGFEVAEPPFTRRVFGREGHSLAETWRGSPKAHLGTTIVGFPNLFLLTGPNTGLGHNSMILMIESQLELIVGALRELDHGGSVTLEPRPEAQQRFVDLVERGGAGTVWTAGGCSSWYLDDTGRNSTLWPWSTYAFRRRAKFDAADYVIGA